MKDAEIDVGVLGLKELTPFRLLPVSNPYVRFSVGGKKVSAQTKSAKARKGNANFFEVLYHKINFLQIHCFYLFSTYFFPLPRM